MRYETIGREIYRGTAFQVYTADEPFLIDASEPGLGDTFQLMFIEEGAVLVHSSGGTRALIPPLALCVNYREPCDGMELTGCRGFSIVFKPEVVNHSLSLLDRGTNPADRAFQANKVLINPFLMSNRDNPFSLSLDQGLQERIVVLYRDLKSQLDGQADEFWPCRSRSFFLEILMFIHNLHGIDRGHAEQMVLPDGDDTVRTLCAAAQVGYPRKELSLRLVCRERGLPVGPSARAFRRALGRSFEDYLAEVRVTVASVLVRNTILGLDVIRARCGYSHGLAQTLAFRRTHRMGPAVYRAAHPNPYG